MTTTQVQIVMASHVNGAGRLFGGQLMAWIDVTAAVEARRHAQSEVVTLQIDELTFLRPAHLNDTIVLKADVTWTGHTSLEVRVDVYVEPLAEPRLLVNRAYIVFVALDEEGHSHVVAPFVPETEEEKAEWAAAEERRDRRMKKRASEGA